MAVQVSISGQAVVFVVRTMSHSLLARAGLWTYIAFFLAQVTLVYVNLFASLLQNRGALV